MNFRYGRGAILLLLWLTACARQPTPAPTPVVTPVTTAAVAPRGGGVTASGELIPVQKAVLSFPTTGRIQKVAGAVGEPVAANAVVMVLEHAAAQAAVVQAQATLFQAQAHLAELMAGPRPQEIAIAQANLETMQAQLAQLTEPTRAEEVAAARAEVAAAQAALQQLANGPREEERIAALALSLIHI
jgi:multidrug efflux pump subunit AcrA (membrane-fusion protein)